MPKQNESSPQYEQNEFAPQPVDGDDYTWQGPAGFRIADNPLHVTWPAPIYDTRTLDERINSKFADLDTIWTVLIDEVRHLREDVARMKNGESEL